jgi:hypothetical protein
MADVYSNLPSGTLSNGWEVKNINGKEVFRTELSTGGLVTGQSVTKVQIDFDPATGNYTAWQKTGLFDGGPNQSNTIYTYSATNNTFTKGDHPSNTFDELSKNNNAGLNNLGGQIKSTSTQNLLKIQNSANASAAAKLIK